MLLSFVKRAVGRVGDSVSARDLPRVRTMSSRLERPSAVRRAT